jgi:hypothetical protein
VDGSKMKAVATLARTPEELTKATGATFTATKDDLGPFVYAIVLCDDKPYVLQRYDNSLDSGTQVIGLAWDDELMHAMDAPTAWRAEK